jgi:hypothetical protein
MSAEVRFRARGVYPNHYRGQNKWFESILGRMVACRNIKGREALKVHMCSDFDLSAARSGRRASGTAHVAMPRRTCPRARSSSDNSG